MVFVGRMGGIAYETHGGFDKTYANRAWLGTVWGACLHQIVTLWENVCAVFVGRMFGIAYDKTLQLRQNIWRIERSVESVGGHGCNTHD